MKETKELAAQLATEVLDGFSSYTKQVCALFGGVRAFEMVFAPEIKGATGIVFNMGTETRTNIDPTYIGERRNLSRLLGGDSYLDTLNIVECYSSTGKSREIRPGDYIEMPVKVPEVEIDGVKYEAIDIEKTELTVVHVNDKHVFFNFEDVLLYGAMNQKNTNNGGFSETTLKEYLNGPFFENVFRGMERLFQKTGDGFYISVPTKHEVFGAGNDDDFNWPELCTVQFDYFRKYKNRIKTRDDDTKWWWLATAADATYFCYASYIGGASYSYASSNDGGVAPLLCI